MKILYIHQYFRTPETGGCIRSYHLASGLVKAGHEVTLITAHSGRHLQQDIQGIHVHYLPVAYRNSFGFVRRACAFLKFVALTKRRAAKLIKQGHQYDLAYVMTTPLTTGLVALHLKKRYSIPFYFEVGDLWPEAPIRMGAIKNRGFRDFLYRFERRCYHEAQKVIALSPAIRNYIEATSPLTKVYVITNISDTRYFQPTPKKGEAFTIGYIGTFGAANHLDYLIDVAKLCQDQQVPVQFVLMGGGADYNRIKRSSSKLKNVSIYPFGDTSTVRHLMERLDAVYVSFLDLEILNTGSPNKFFDGLAAGKMIILNFGGWIREVVEKSGCGFYHTPNEPQTFMDEITKYLDSPKRVKECQANARNLAESYYDKSLQIERLIKILNNEKHINLDGAHVYILTA